MIFTADELRAMRPKRRTRPPKQRVTYKTPGLLTRRQREAVMLLGEGLSQKDIGRRFGVTENAVQRTLHRARIQMGAKNTIHLVVIVHKAQ